MKIILFGVNGQLGSVLYEGLKVRGNEVIGLTHADIDIADKQTVTDVITDLKPDCVVNCAAYNAVDRAESEEVLCRMVNTDAVGFMAAASESVGAKFMTFSSDYVFDGKSSTPITEDTPKNPLNIYGRSKADSEELALKLCSRSFVVRVTWLYGPNGSNFVNTMLKLALTHDTLRVVNDQVGSPTFAEDLVPALCDMLESDKYGVYNLSNSGFCTWYEFACKIFELADAKINVIPVTTAEYGSKAARPLNSRLSKEKAEKCGFAPLPSWEDALKRFFEKRVK